MACELERMHVIHPCMRVFVLAALLLTQAPALAADVRVLTATGTVVDGLGIGAIDDPQATAGGMAVFRATSTSITVGGLTLASGDALPAPLEGSIGTIEGGIVAGSHASVLIVANGASAASAILTVDGGVAAPLVWFAPSTNTTIARFAMNTAGDIVYHTRSVIGGGAIHRHSRASGTTTTIAGPLDELTSVRGLVVDESGAAAWMDRTGDVFHWSPTGGLALVGGGRRSVARRNASPVALDATLGLVFVTRDMVGRWRPGDMGFTVLAFARATVGDVTVRRFYGDVGFDVDGRVVVRVRPAATGYLCLDEDAATCSVQGKSSAGTAAPVERSGAIVQVDGEATTTLLRSGTVIPGAGVLAEITSHFADETSVTFTGTLRDGREVLARRADSGMQAIATSDTLDFTDQILDAARGGVLMSNPDTDGLLLIEADGRTRTIHPPSGKRIRTTSLGDAVIAGRRVVAVGDGVFTTTGTRLRPAAVFRASGTVPPLARGGGGVAFAVLLPDGGSRIFSLRRGRPALRGTLPVAPKLLAVDRRQIAAVALSPEHGDDTIWRIGRGGPTALLSGGDPTPIGTVGTIDSIAVVGDEVLFVATLRGDGPRRALLAVGMDR